MKVFTLIMSLYLVILSSLPCGDSRECASVGKDHHQETPIETQHHPDHGHAEACTPFCNCACCVSACFQPAAQFHFSVIQTSQVELPYQEVFHSYDVQAIWQPPKIG